MVGDEIDLLLDPDLPREEVIDARRRLVRAWADHPDDLGARALAILCVQLARSYYKKARKDGTIERARVINTRTQPLLDATFRDWPALVKYLRERLADADAAPVSVPAAGLPDLPPEPVRERVRVARTWWDAFVAQRRAQDPRASARARVIPRPWDEEDDELAADAELEPSAAPRRPSYRDGLPSALAKDIGSLWGQTVLPRHPSVLIGDTQPFSKFVRILQPAANLWEGLVASCWDLSFGEYTRYGLDELERAEEHNRRVLERLGAPVDTGVYAALLTIGRDYTWLANHASRSVTFSLNVSKSGQVAWEREHVDVPVETRGAVFVRLREVITDALDQWVDRHADRFLDARWRLDLTMAAEAYSDRYRGRGKAPTLKQALPDLLPAAELWFGGDYGLLARVLGLDGPVTESPHASSRRLPDNPNEIRREVARFLRSRTAPRKMDEHEVRFRINELAAKSSAILAHWQAVGATPSRTAILSAGESWIAEQLFSTDAETAYRHLLDGVREALQTRDHEAASDLSSEPL